MSAVLGAALLPQVLMGQSCPLVALPYRTMVRPITLGSGQTPEIHTSSDMRIAVGETRIIVTSNSGVRIHCKNVSPITAQAPMAGLSATEINTALFVPTTANGTFQSFQITDPRVIYDGYAKRFWIVACEQDLIARRS
jgi:hypothetical protein